MKPYRSLHDLKIVVASTPKTGNNWIKKLLATTYNLPEYSLAEPFTFDEVHSLGDRWIAQNVRSVCFSMSVKREYSSVHSSRVNPMVSQT